MTDWTNIRVKLGDLKPWPMNPRQSTKKQAARLLASFDEFGQVQTVAVGPDLEVYDGHQRLSALLTVHGPDYEIDARQSSRPLTDAERRKLVAWLHAGAVGSWDWDALSGWDAGELIDWGFDSGTLADWKRDVSALDNLLESEKPEPSDAEPEIDRAEVLREKWGTERGQLWRIGEHRLLCGDSTVREDVERVMGGEKALCMWTDPPYGVEYVGKTKDALTIENDGADGLDNLLHSVFQVAEAVLVEGAPYYVAHPPGALQRLFWNALHDCGWKIHEQLVWVKDSMVLGHSDYHLKHETILYGWTPGEGRPGRGDHDGTRWYGDNSQVSVFEIPRPKRSELHPTMKPSELVEAHIENSTPWEGLVYEPFAGSGTALVACENLGRKCRAIEISPAYCAVILERMATAFPEIEIELLDTILTNR